MLHGLGRLLQFAGLILLPLAILMELSNSLSRHFGVSDMVIMMVCGVAAFMSGRILEGYGR